MPSAVIVNDAFSCIEKLSSYHWDTVYLDHDLGGEIFVDAKEKNSGSEVVRFIVDKRPSIGKIIVHSLNPVERKNMVMGLLKAGYVAKAIPWILLKERL